MLDLYKCSSSKLILAMAVFLDVQSTHGLAKSEDHDKRQKVSCLSRSTVAVALRLRCSVCSLIFHELQLSSVLSTTLIFISTHTEQ